MTKFFCFEIHRYKVFCTLCANHVFADGFFLFVKVKEISLTDNWKTHLATTTKSKHHKPTNYLITWRNFWKLFNLTFSIDSNQSKGRAYIIKIKGEREVGSSYYVCSRKYIMLQYLEKKYFELWFPSEFLRSRIFNGAKLTSPSVPWHWYLVFCPARKYSI